MYVDQSLQAKKVNGLDKEAYVSRLNEDDSSSS